MKKLIFLLSVLLITGSVSLAQTVSTPTLSGEDVPAVGGVIEMPINVSDFPSSVFGVLIYVEYDPSVISFTGVINNSDPTKITVSNMSPTILRIQMYHPNFVLFTIPDGELVSLGFTYLGGNSDLAFITNAPYASEYFNTSFVAVAIPNLVDGAVLGGFVDNIIVDGAWETALDWSLDVVPNSFHNVFVEGAASISSSAVANDLSIAIDGELTVNDGAALAVSGDFLIDSDPTGTGSFVNLGAPLMFDGTVKQFMPGFLAWHLVSVPVNAVESYDVFLNCYLQTWNEPGSVWVDVQPDQWTSVTLNTPMLGYATAFHGTDDKMLEFTGMLNDGPYSIAVTALGTSGNPDYDGWNLVGNPYPSALDVDGAGWTRVNVGNGVAYWDETIDNYRYYAFGVPANNGSQFIPPMQGFFVKASANGTIGVSNAARAHTTQNFYKSDPTNTLRLLVQHGNFSDEAVIRFAEDAGVNYDEQFDFFKLVASEDVPQIYSVTSNNESLAINAMPSINNEIPVNVGFKAGVDAMMSLTASGINSFDDMLPVWLYDQVADVQWNLRDNPVYNFVANTEDDVNRFQIHFKTLTGVPGMDQQVANIFAINKQVYVDAGNAKGEIIIMNVLGQELVREALTEQMNVITLPVSNSYVVVKVISDQGISSRKVFVD
ncbi:MAG: hypothetical protein IH597_12495 [Bacteroidales bacterium]|nr:hypothetical protein [Bacteroidales bacterium]